MTWRPPPKDTWNGILLGFKLIYFETALGNSSRTTVDVKIENGSIVAETLNSRRQRRYIEDENMIFRLNITDLRAFTNYTFMVMSYNSLNGPYTPAVTMVTDEGGKLVCIL